MRQEGIQDLGCVPGLSVTGNGSGGPATLAGPSNPSLLKLAFPCHLPRDQPHKRNYRSETNDLDHRAPHLNQHEIRPGLSHAPMQLDGGRLRPA